MTTLPEPTITYEMRRPLVELRIAIRHAFREVRDAWAFIRAAYRQREATDAELTMYGLALFDGEVGGDTVQAQEFQWYARSRGYGVKQCEMLGRIDTAHVVKRGPHFHKAVRA